MTPPVVRRLDMVSIVTGTSVGRVIRGVVPFRSPLLPARLAATLEPSRAIWLPGSLR